MSESLKGLFDEKLSEAEMVLVGLGNEFDVGAMTENDAITENVMREQGASWLIPAYYEFSVRKDVIERRTKLKKALEGLACLLLKKNCFILSLSQGRLISETKWREGRLVMPCGSVMKKQCQHCCAGEEIEEISSMEEKGIQSLFDDFPKGIVFESQEYSDLQKMPQEVRMAMELIQKKEKIREEVCRLENAVKELLGKCGHCGESLIFNVVQAKEYDEKGYLKNWEYYTKWLYGSMNRKLLILELGTAQTHPGLFGDAFQKICELNPKAERFLFQAENFENAIDWLAKL